MVQENYQKLLDRIAQSAGLEVSEIERRVEAKRAKLSGLISLEGAAQVIAAELGISFEDEIFKIDELLPGMRKVRTQGKVIRLFPVREFTTKKGEQSKVANLILADDTSNIRVVLWDTKQIELIDRGDIAEGKAIEIANASMRDNELHLGSFSEIRPSSATYDQVQTEPVVKEKTLSDVKVGEEVKVRAFIVQAFDLRFFEVNAATGRKMTDEERSSGATALRKALITVVLDDGTETIRSVVFHDQLPSLGLTSLEDESALQGQRQLLLGGEFLFSGSIRQNNYFNTPELVVQQVQPVNVEELLSSLE